MSLSTVTVSCLQCGKTKEIPPAWVKKSKRKFCDRRCYTRWTTGRPLAKEHVQKIKAGLKPMTDEHKAKIIAARKLRARRENRRVKLRCALCGREKDLKLSETKKFKYCSKECFYAAKTKTKKKGSCLVCGKDFEVFPSRPTAIFCSQPCHYRWMIDWDSKSSRGHGWVKWRRMCKERDAFKCQICGVSEVPGRWLHAHHIVPYGISKNNGLENLITVCAGDHRRLEHFTVAFYYQFQRNLTWLIVKSKANR